MTKKLNIKFTVCIFITVLLLFNTVNSAFCDNVAAKNKQNITNKIKAENSKAQIISAHLFSVSLPAETKGIYYAEKRKDRISIYDKASKKAGFGGFAFGIAAYKHPEDHAVMPGSRKIGELEDKNGEIYDIVLNQPTDVQFDYINGKSLTYDTLYKLADNISDKISARKNAVYYNNRGMLGKDLYKEILDKHYTAIKEKWNSSRLEEEDMSYMYNVLATANKNVLNNIGYIYYDVNGDGIDELFIGEITKGNLKGIIYDIYTMVNRKPVHVVSGGSRNRYFVCDDYFLCNERSGGADETQWLVYTVVENSTELFPQVGFKYDGYKDKKHPWYISYNITENEWENVSEETFKNRKSVFERYKRFDYKPLINIDKQ